MPDELDVLISDLAIVGPHKTTYTSPMERYGEFRRLFLDTDEGRRVLREILVMGGVNRVAAVRGDPYETYLRQGETNLAFKIFNAALVEPGVRPTTQRTREE